MLEENIIEQYAPLLERLPLFTGIAVTDYGTVLNDLAARVRNWREGSFPLMEGDRVPWIGVLLTGGARVMREDYLGRRAILTALGPGDIFAETFALAGVPATVGVQAAADCAVLLLDYAKPLSGQSPLDRVLIGNLLAMTARKNLHLNERLSFLEKRTIRERLLGYLSAEARRKNSRQFTIPFDRQGLADYLSVDRSALSAELSHMEREGFLKTQRSKFTLAEGPGLHE